MSHQGLILGDVTETLALSLSRRRASSGRLRGMAHLVRMEPADSRLVVTRLALKALCGFKPKRHWSVVEAPSWEETCPKCEAAAARPILPGDRAWYLFDTGAMGVQYTAVRVRTVGDEFVTFETPRSKKSGRVRYGDLQVVEGKPGSLEDWADDWARQEGRAS